MLLDAWLWAARARRNFQRLTRPLGPVERLVSEHAPGRSFVDVGAIWAIHGRTAFLAEDSGATKVTAVDIQPATPEFERERERRGSSMRFVLGDIHDGSTIEQIGVHDVVWCSGLLYHAPNPLHTIACLREITGQTLILISATVPELPGIRNASVFFPALPERARRSYDRAFNAVSGIEAARVGLTTPFDPGDSYAAWWWGLTPSTIESMVEASGFRLADTKTSGYHTRVVATR